MKLKYQVMRDFLKEIGAEIIQRGEHLVQEPYFLDFNYRSKDYYFVIDDTLEDQIELWDWARMFSTDSHLLKISLSDPESLIKLRQYMNSL